MPNTIPPSVAEFSMEECERLREVNRELVYALEALFEPPSGSPAVDRIVLAAAWESARAALAKAKGE